MAWRAFPDASVLLEIRQAKGVISNWDRTLREKLNELFPPIFDPIVVSQEIGVAKPNVEIYLEAVRLSGVQPEQIIFVGDSIHLDIVPALSVGMKPILLDRTGYYNLYNGLKISSLNELPSIIDGIEG